MASRKEREIISEVSSKDWSELELSKSWQITPEESFIPKLKVHDIRSSFIYFKSLRHIELEDNLKQYKDGVVGLQDNWDGQGSRGFHLELWDKVVSFLKKILYEVWDNMYDLQIPLVLPSPDGSFDIHWESDNFELLVNIPPDQDDLVHLYGEKTNFSEHTIEVRINYELADKVLIEWLKKIL